MLLTLIVSIFLSMYCQFESIKLFSFQKNGIGKLFLISKK